MTKGQSLQRLLTWLSPAFPVGAFAWSAGLETAIAGNLVHDQATTREWIENGLHHGGLRTDAILLAHAHQSFADAAKLADLADLCLALSPSLERYDEVTTTGNSFILAARAWPSEVYDRLPEPCPYAIAVGAIAAAHDIVLGDTLLAFLTTTVHGQISVAIRLVPLGQSAGLAIMAALEPTIAALAQNAANAGLEDIGTIAYAADIAQMRHETLHTRIFRS
jgi:urease accessory protein